MDLQLHGKVALVSGGGSGIGEAIVRLFLSEGASVCIADRNRSAGEALIDSLPSASPPAMLVVGDLSEEAECDRAVRECVARFQGLDILINNAGVNDKSNIDEPLERFIGSLQANLWHVYSLTHFARPHLTATAGCIVNITSKVATTGQGGTSGYAAAKGAVNGLTREWAVEFAPHGIRVNAVAPAEVMTPMYQLWLAAQADPEATRQNIASLIPLGRRFTTADEIAATAVFLASPVSSHTTGQILHPDGGYVHLDRAHTS